MSCAKENLGGKVVGGSDGSLLDVVPRPGHQASRVQAGGVGLDRRAGAPHGRTVRRRSFCRVAGIKRLCHVPRAHRRGRRAVQCRQLSEVRAPPTLATATIGRAPRVASSLHGRSRQGVPTCISVPLPLRRSRRAQRCIQIVHAVKRPAKTGQAEIRQLDVSVSGYEYVVGFDIAVYDPLGVAVLEGEYDLTDVPPGDVLVERAHAAEQRRDIPAIRVLHDDINIVPGCEGKVEADDERVARHCQDVPLVSGRLDHVLPHEVSLAHHLDRKKLTRFVFAGQIDPTESPFTNGLEDFEVVHTDGAPRRDRVTDWLVGPPTLKRQALDLLHDKPGQRLSHDSDLGDKCFCLLGGPWITR